MNSPPENLLAQKLAALILCRGPITFRKFMEFALYDPELGYYNTETQKIGAAGDFYTSSNVHEAFGASLARLFAGWLAPPTAENVASFPVDERLTEDQYQILEVGAGTGQLAHDILEALRVEHPQVYSLVKYVIAERSPAMERLQRGKLGHYLYKVQWSGVTVDGHPGIQDVKGIVLSNELIDALPAHVVRSAADGLQELYVACKDRSDSNSGGHNQAPDRPVPIAEHSEFCYWWGPLSSARLDEYLRRLGAQLSVGQIIEINLDAIDWLQAVARILRAGYLVTIDYGDMSQHLYGQDRRGGTLRAFHKHALAGTVLERVGEQDITSSVNFTALMEYGRDAGLETMSFERQSAFLIRMGLIDRIAALETPANIIAGLKNRLAIKNLFVPGGSSDNFRVLIQRKKVP